MGAKRATPEQIAKFRRDLDYLIEVKKYANADIAARLPVDATNLSSYRSGKKDPGVQIITRFYKQFANEIEPAKYESAGPSDELGEAQVLYMRRNYQGEIDSLRDDKQFLKDEMRVINRTHEKTADANLLEAQNRQEWIASSKEIVQTSREIARNNTELATSIRLLLQKNNPS